LGSAFADPHETANAADKRGDFAAELAILLPNADKGLIWAENNLGNLYEGGTMACRKTMPRWTRRHPGLLSGLCEGSATFVS
jgi:hypothetical protein